MTRFFRGFAMGKMVIASLRARAGQLGDALHRRSVRLVHAAEWRIGFIALIWTGLLALVLAARLAMTASVSGFSGAWLESATLYALVLLSPLAGLILAMRAFPRDTLLALPTIALARMGNWIELHPLAAAEHPRFGAGGLMAGLAIGLLINIPMRTAEFLAAVPAVAGVGPGWSHAMFVAFGIDCIVFNLAYAAVFVMAVRHVPWFPRMMLLVWLMDLTAQIMIARTLGTFSLPVPVASALAPVLTGNLQKCLISMALWMPYLMLSERVNVTYRRRVRLPA